MFSYSSHSTNSHITQTFHRFKTPHAGLKSEWLTRQKWISFSALATLFIFHISVSCSVQLPSVFLHSDSLWLTSAGFNQPECVSSDSLIERVDYGSYSEPILSPFKSIKSAITQNNHTGFRLNVWWPISQCVNLKDDDSCHSAQIHSSSYSRTQSNIKGDQQLGIAFKTAACRSAFQPTTNTSIITWTWQLTHNQRSQI